MTLSLCLFLVGIIGFLLNRNNLILILICIEILLVSITLFILITSFNHDDIFGETFSIYILAIAGAESALGLGLLVTFYRLRGNLNITISSLCISLFLLFLFLVFFLLVFLVENLVLKVVILFLVVL